MAKVSKTKETAKKMTSAPEKSLTKAPKAAAKAIMAKEMTKKSAKAPVKAAKADKKSEKIEIKATELPTSENTEEEDEDMADVSSGSAAQSGLALAAATADTAAGSLKNFRHHPDIENFYRFIFENDLRYEALEIIDLIAVQRENQKKSLKAGGKAKH